MRKLMLIVLFMLAAGAAHAADNQWFVGGGYGHWEAETTTTDTSSGLALENEADGEYLELRVGGIFDRIRVYGTYQDPTDEAAGASSYLLTLNGDYLLLPRARQFNVFVGGKLGYYNEQVDNFFADGTDLEWDSTLLGVEAGVLYDLAPVQLEAGARYMVGAGSDNNWPGVDTELDKLSEVYGAVNFLF
jgi:hypothetical protein